MAYGSHISWREEGGEGMATSFSPTGSELEMLCYDLGAGMEAQMSEPVGIGFGKPVLAGRCRCSCVVDRWWL